MYHPSPFIKCDVFGVEEEKRREEKRREEKRREERTLNIYPTATAAGVSVFPLQYIIIRYQPFPSGKVVA
jgi:hypothetical protein